MFKALPSTQSSSGLTPSQAPFHPETTLEPRASRVLPRMGPKVKTKTICMYAVLCTASQCGYPPTWGNKVRSEVVCSVPGRTRCIAASPVRKGPDTHNATQRNTKDISPLGSDRQEQMSTSESGELVPSGTYGDDGWQRR